MPSARNTALSRVSGIRKEARVFVKHHGWTQTILLLIGVTATLAVLGALLVAAGDTPDSIYTDSEVAPVNSDLFARSLSLVVNSPLDQGGTISVLNNGDEFLPQLIQAIDGAKHTIDFSVYIWRDGEFSKQVLDALLRARKRNVEVRVLLDGFGAKDIAPWKFSDLNDAGARIEKFRTPQFGKLTRLHRRNHRRSIVIDGEVGFTGGMAVGDEWLGHAEDPDHWRDMMFKMTGPLAQSLQAAFVGAWAASSGEILTSRSIYPIDADRSPPSDVEKFIHIVNSPASEHHSMAHFFIMSILAARESVYVVTPYFIPDKHLQKALEDKARAGVDVRLLLPGRHIDNAIVRWSAQAHYEDLLKAGVKIYEYQPTFIHTKFLVVDGQWSVIGSPNLNSRSRNLDEENALGILDAKFAHQLTDVFHSDAGHAHQIRLDEWQRRNILGRLLERAAQTLDKQS